MKIVSSGKMTAIDREAQEGYGIPSLILMENAALKSCYLFMERLLKGSLSGQNFLFVAGKGNNGGDALVMARQFFLMGARKVCVLLAAGEPPEGSDPHVNLKICRNLGIPVISFREFPQKALRFILESQWIFDGIAGTGIKGELKEELRPLIDGINQGPGKVAAIDIPSGLGDRFKKGFLCVKAHCTLTMGLPKTSLYLPFGRPFCGDIFPVTLGFPPPLIQDPGIPGELLEEEGLGTLNPPIPLESYKNSRGHLAVFAGSRGTTGAAWLASCAAARSRAGLVTLFTGKELYPLMAGRFGSVMVNPDYPGQEQWPRYSAILAGPGWGTRKGRAEALSDLLALEKPIVLDADGIILLGELLKKGPAVFSGGAVLTPHPGEFAGLTGVCSRELLEDPLPLLQEWAARLGAVIVLKIHVTYIVSPGGIYSILDGMNPALGTAGSGDILAGLIGGFLAARMSPYDAARKGVLVHHLAGRDAYRDEGWFTADDLLPRLSLILKNREQGGLDE